VPDGPPRAMCTLVFELPPREIVNFKAIIESYDNLATLRTEDPRAIGSNFIRARDGCRGERATGFARGHVFDPTTPTELK